MQRFFRRRCLCLQLRCSFAVQRAKGQNFLAIELAIQEMILLAGVIARPTQVGTQEGQAGASGHAGNKIA